MTERTWTLAEVQALSPEQVRTLSPGDFVAALRAARGEEAGVTRFECEEVLLPEGSAWVYLDRPGAESAGGSPHRVRKRVELDQHQQT